MIKYVVKRFAQMIVVLFIVSLLVFLLTNFIGDPVDMLVPENATLEQPHLEIGTGRCYRHQRKHDYCHLII